MQELQLEIEEFTSKGYGLAYVKRQNGSPSRIEVAHTAIGDRVLASVQKKSKRIKKGKLLEILNPSHSRIEPRCKHANICGGCTWQHIAYEQQLCYKEALVQKAFKENLLTAEFYPIIPCVFPWQYRNKMEFSFSENRGGQKYLGLTIAHARSFVYNTEQCHLASPWFTQLLNAVRKWWEDSELQAYNYRDNSGTLRSLTIREGIRTNEKLAYLTIAANPEYVMTKPQIESFKQAVISIEPNISLFLRLQQSVKGQPTEFFEMHLNGLDHIKEQITIELFNHKKTFTFKISPTSFFQPNTQQAEKLYQTALSLLPIDPTSTVFDLYCGTGTLGMAIASHIKQVIGIESNPHAVLDAEVNLSLNNITNYTIYQGDVGKVLTKLYADPAFKYPDAAIIDPPRSGLDALALHHLKVLKPKNILYISCNPNTQAENIQELLESGYTLKKIQPIDQFPHTIHIENIALLVRNNA